MLIQNQAKKFEVDGPLHIFTRPEEYATAPVPNFGAATKAAKKKHVVTVTTKIPAITSAPARATGHEYNEDDDAVTVTETVNE
jgi:hypothetical protein